MQQSLQLPEIVSRSIELLLLQGLVGLLSVLHSPIGTNTRIDTVSASPDHTITALLLLTNSRREWVKSQEASYSSQLLRRGQYSEALPLEYFLAVSVTERSREAPDLILTVSSEERVGGVRVRESEWDRLSSSKRLLYCLRPKVWASVRVSLRIFAYNTEAIYNIVMGASQQQPCEIWITIEKNPQHIEKDVFDFVKEREVQSSYRASFPSSLSLHPTSNLLQYSVLQDPSRELFTLNLQGPNEVLLQLSTRQDRPPIWKYLSENDVVELEEGDNIKLGRVQLYLKELRFIQNKPNRSKPKKQPQQVLSIRPSRPKEGSNRSISDSPLRNSGHFGKNSGIFGKHHFSRARDSELGSLKKSMGQSGISGISGNERSCRICFDGCQSRDNPLFNVCLCQGSVKYVHFECLRSWFRSKTVKYQTPHCLYYCYQPLQCEICKYAISNQVSHEGVNYSLYQYQQIHPPFAKLEHFAEGKVYEILIRLEEPLDISVGRGAENDVNLNDSSISRGHCMLEYSSQRLFLRALNSRYGSFIELGGNVELGEEPAGLSVSNHMVWLMRKAKPSGIMQCCETEGKAMLVIR